MLVIYKIALSAVLMILVSMERTMSNPHHHNHRDCREPEDLEELKTRHIHDNPIHESMHNVPPFPVRPRHLRDIQTEAPRFVNITIDHEYGRMTCPSLPQHGGGQINTTCPWYYVQNTDENRYPRIIFHAVCRCLNCLEFVGDYQTGNMCKPVPSYIRVLRRTGCSRGRYLYETILEPMPTGCTCTAIRAARSRIHSFSQPLL